MKREGIEKIIGEMTVIGYFPETITLNPGASTEYCIVLTQDNKIYMSIFNEDNFEMIPTGKYCIIKGVLDKFLDASRFKIKTGNYAAEYVIEEIEITEQFKTKSDYLRWIQQSN